MTTTNNEEKEVPTAFINEEIESTDSVVTPEITEVKGMVADKGDYKVSVKYSDEAIEKKLMKFETPSGESFEISVEHMIELVSHYVNGSDLAPMFVDNERIKIVYVTRNMKFKLDKDFKAGEEIVVAYEHPYPLEFAIIEEAFNIALIKPDKMGFMVTPEILAEVKRRTPQDSKKFIEKFYQSNQNLDMKKDEEELGNSS